MTLLCKKKKKRPATCELKTERAFGVNNYETV